jgi:hypothetical protein
MYLVYRDIYINSKLRDTLKLEIGLHSNSLVDLTLGVVILKFLNCSIYFFLENGKVHSYLSIFL